MTQSELSSGKVLLAEPFMLDGNFKRAALMLCEHNSEGSIGFVLNKEMDVRINEIMDDFPKFDAPMFFGGPVGTDTIHYLHRRGDILDDSVEILEGLYWGGDFTKLKFLIDTKLILPEDIRFFVGYSGWSPGQLAEEMETGSWLVAEMYPTYLFKSKPKDLWSEIMMQKGNAYEVIAGLPDGGNLN